MNNLETKQERYELSDAEVFEIYDERIAKLICCQHTYVIPCHCPHHPSKGKSNKCSCPHN